MARLFSLKPLVFALGICFGTTYTYAADTAAAEDADYRQSGKTDEAAESTLSLGSTCLFCDKTQADGAAAEAVVRSGEEAMPEDYTRIVADEVEGQSQVSVRADGNVIIERNRAVLNAQWAEYSQADDTVSAGDRFALKQEDSLIQGEKLSYNLTQQTGTAHNVRVESEQDGRRLQSVSRKAEAKGKGRYALTDTQFNTCSSGDASWYIKAGSIETDQELGVGVAKHASLVFGGVPVFYTPWADFPLNGNRKSGLLVPTVSTGSDGLSVSTPYYFNLAPNLDATFAPGFISERGAVADGQVRYLQPEYSGQTDLTWLPHDKKGKRNNRYQAKWKHSHAVSDKLQMGIDFNQVSDNSYYRDFYGSEDIASNVNLNRQIWAGYSSTLAGGNFTGTLNAQKYQTLANQNGYKDQPYGIMPRLSAQWQKHSGAAQIGVTGQFTRFTHDDKQDGSRLVVYPSVKWDFGNRWGYIRPKVGLHSTYYNLNSDSGKEARRLSRTLPIVNVDSGITFERRTRLLGDNVLQTLEPRLFYNYIPARQQNDLPNFDSSENSFGYAQLFRENLYYGNDRINAANSLSVAAQSRILNPETGEERFRAGLGQKFYFKNDTVMLDGNIGTNSRSRSDWVGFASGNVSSSLSFDTDIHYNQNDKRIENYAFGASYRPAPGKVLNARYKYGRNERIYLNADGSYHFDRINQIDLSAQWPLSKNLYAVARYNYEFEVKKPINMLAGAEYRSSCGCWSASVYGQRYVTGENSYKNAVFFTLQLKDLSNAGGKQTDRLRNAVPGYTPSNALSGASDRIRL